MVKFDKTDWEVQVCLTFSLVFLCIPEIFPEKKCNIESLEHLYLVFKIRF